MCASPPSTGGGPCAIADTDNAAQLKTLPISAPYRNDKRAKGLSPILGPTYVPLSC
jgi:hypothetical protein